MAHREKKWLQLRSVGLVAALSSLGAGAHAGAFLAESSSARLLVAPPQTEVYVDGERVGTADDFDGFTQRLRVSPGEHEIELFLEGYRSVREKVLFGAGRTYKIRHTMELLLPGEPRSQPPEPFAPVREPQPRSHPSSYGALAINVRPLPATLWIDGEHWEAAEGFEVRLAPGRHEVEIGAEGRVPYSTRVHVLEGETTALNVSLMRSDPTER